MFPNFLLFKRKLATYIYIYLHYFIYFKSKNVHQLFIFCRRIGTGGHASTGRMIFSHKTPLLDILTMVITWMTAITAMKEGSATLPPDTGPLTETHFSLGPKTLPQYTATHLTVSSKDILISAKTDNIGPLQTAHFIKKSLSSFPSSRTSTGSLQLAPA